MKEDKKRGKRSVGEEEYSCPKKKVRVNQADQRHKDLQEKGGGDDMSL